MLYFRPLAIPRNPLLRLALAALGIALMFFVLMFGLVIGAVLLGLGAVAWLVRQFTHGATVGRPAPAPASAPSPAAAPGVIEGEYVVLRKRDGAGE